MDEPARILVVCTANICRSPMAEHLLATYLALHAPDAKVVVTSAGTIARPGHPAASGMRRIAHSWGIDLEQHRSRRVDAELAVRQDLIVTMEDAHRSAVARLATGVGRRTYTLSELAAVIDATQGSSGHAGQPDDTSSPAAARLEDAVGQWNSARARHALVTEDVPDPYGGPEDGYREAAWLLAGYVERIGPTLRDILVA